MNKNNILSRWVNVIVECNHASYCASIARTSHVFMIALLVALFPLCAIFILPPELHAAANTITVNNTTDPTSTSDNGFCTLREAIDNSNNPGTDTTQGDCAVATGNDVITFSFSGTITLSSTLPAIANASPNTLTIDGSGRTVTVDGAGAYQVLVVNSSATLNLNNLTIAHGYSPFTNSPVDMQNGGGISNEGTLTVSNSTFSSNTISSNLSGGGIFSSGTLTVNTSTFSDNNAPNSVGGGIASPGTLVVTNSTFTSNSATYGAGIYLGLFGLGRPSGSSATITNSTLVGNSAAQGGGIFENADTVTITNTTFSNNNASSPGGNILNELGTVTLSNSVLAGGSSGGNCYQNTAFATTIPGGVTDGGYNISDDSSCSFGSPTGADGQTLGDNVNPLLSANGLQSNGGPTETISLQSTSPAIDAIPQGNANCPGLDQRGFGRPAPGYNACDVGAYEFAAVPPVSCTVTYNGTFRGNLNISSGLTCIIGGTVTGNVTESGGALYTSDATIGGNLQITGGGTFSMASTVVDGDLQIQNIPTGSAQNQICGTNVKGNLTFHNNGTAVAIGTTSASCPGDTIGNDLQINNNTAAVQVFDDTVKGNLQCQNNSTITGSGDTAKSLQGQCASF